MRKFIALLLALALGSCVFVSCNKDDKNDDNADSAQITESASSDPEDDRTDSNTDSNKIETGNQEPAMDWSKPY